MKTFSVKFFNLILSQISAKFTRVTFQFFLLFSGLAFLSACQSGEIDHSATTAMASEEMMTAAVVESPMRTPSVTEAVAEKVMEQEAPATPTEAIDLVLKNFKAKSSHTDTRRFWGSEQEPLMGRFERITLTHNGKSMLELDCERESMFGKSMLISVQLPTQSDQAPAMMRVMTSQLTYMEGTFVNYENDPYDYYYFKNGRLVDFVRQDGNNTSNKTNLVEQLRADSVAILSNSLLREVSTLLFFNNKVTDFSGTWNHVKNTDDYQFSTQLQQVGEFVFGTYCGYTPTKYDCELDSQGGSPCFVTGKVENDTLRLEFRPCYTEGSGTAKLFFNEQEMVWQTTNHPEGFSTVPAEGRLQQ